MNKTQNEMDHSPLESAARARDLVAATAWVNHAGSDFDPVLSPEFNAFFTRELEARDASDEFESLVQAVDDFANEHLVFYARDTAFMSALMVFAALNLPSQAELDDEDAVTMTAVLYTLFDSLCSAFRDEIDFAPLIAVYFDRVATVPTLGGANALVFADLVPFGVPHTHRVSLETVRRVYAANYDFAMSKFLELNPALAFEIYAADPSLFSRLSTAANQPHAMMMLASRLDVPISRQLIEHVRATQKWNTERENNDDVYRAYLVPWFTQWLRVEKKHFGDDLAYRGSPAFADTVRSFFKGRRVGQIMTEISSDDDVGADVVSLLIPSSPRDRMYMTITALTLPSLYWTTRLRLDLTGRDYMRAVVRFVSLTRGVDDGSDQDERLLMRARYYLGHETLAMDFVPDDRELVNPFVAQWLLAHGARRIAQRHLIADAEMDAARAEILTQQRVASVLSLRRASSLPDALIYALVGRYL